MRTEPDKTTWPPAPQPTEGQPPQPLPPATGARWLGLLLAFGGSLTALYQWALALYRLSLYDGRPGMNHADDFRQVYPLDAWVVPLCLLAVLLLWRQGRRPRRFVVAVALANLLGVLAFFGMHRAGILVTYDEYIQRWGP